MREHAGPESGVSSRAGEATADAGRRDVGERIGELVDRFVGFDPGMTQLRNAVHATSALAVAVCLGYLFQRTTSAMQIADGSAPPAVVAAQHHGALVIGMLLPGLLAMLDSTGVNEGTIRARVVSSIGLWVVFFAAMTCGLVISANRLGALFWLVGASMIAVYIRRFPTRGFLLGVALFNGAFMSFFMHEQIPLHDLGWVAAETAIGTLASVAIRITVFPPDNRRALLRMQRSWVARTHTVIDLAWQLTFEESPRRRERLVESIQRNLVRLNESSLMIDAQLGQPDATAGSAMLLHQRLFDQELALSNVARFTAALAERQLPDRVIDLMRVILDALREQNLSLAVDSTQTLRRLADHHGDDRTTTVLLHRLARSVVDLADAQREWLRAGEDTRRADAPFVPAVSLLAGVLPGSGTLSERAATVAGTRRSERVVLKPYERTTIQIGVASTMAVAFGDLLDGRRLYWAVLATFLSFMATTNRGEQVRKAFFRLLGTAIGIVVGDGLVHLADRNLVLSFVIIAVALFVGFYLVRVNYMFLVVGITVTMSQLYVQLHEFGWNLLLLRLAETAVGAGAVMLTVLLVFPLRTSRVLDLGLADYLDRLHDLVSFALSEVSRLPAGYSDRAPERQDIRSLDVAYQGLLTAATPLRFGLIGRRARRFNERLAVASATRYYARNLAVGVEYSDLEGNHELDEAAAVLLTSMTALVGSVSTGARGEYVRSGALFDQAYRLMPSAARTTVAGTNLVIRDLMLLDGALARLARVEGLAVTDTDTVPTVAAADQRTSAGTPAAP